MSTVILLFVTSCQATFSTSSEETRSWSKQAPLQAAVQTLKQDETGIEEPVSGELDADSSIVNEPSSDNPSSDEVDSVEANVVVADTDVADPGAALSDEVSAYKPLPVPIAPLARVSDAQLQSTRKNALERMTFATRKAEPDSPYYHTTWLTYYGRPNIGVMGILGEYDINTLVRLLRTKANEYDDANGAGISVMPAFHLVYGMATRAPGVRGDYLNFLSDETVMEYIERAEEEGFAVILDIQIGGLTPVASMRYGFPYLKYPNVHLAVDPEFALVHPDQAVPGNPIGYVTAEQVNQVQAAMFQHMIINGIRDRKILLVHQFLDEMIRDKEDLDHSYPIDLTISVDGWGGPGGKISKYNIFVDKSDEFSSFKLFYGWDVPLLTPSQALGLESYDDYLTIDVMPNMIIYQ
ncbi:MAG: hypothetical protein AAF702_37850 [Chloroflexota bacterium]